MSHARYMRQALELADQAAARDEVPIGALVVLGGDVIGTGFNQPIGMADPTAHAEVLALRAAAHALGNYRLAGATLYVTVEPCLMCLGAIAHARLDTLVYGVPEPKTGAIESLGRGRSHVLLPPGLRVVTGVLAAECRDRLQRFFERRRSSTS